MAMTISAQARLLLDFIGKAETGKTSLAAYGVVVFHQETKLPKPLTDYTVDELLSAQKAWASTGWSIKGKKRRGSAAGKYQIIRKTLLGLINQLGIPGSARFTPELQDRLGMALLTARGWQAFTSGQVSKGAFALALAKEWASIPVLSTVQGANRTVKRGESYYAGDGVNSSQKGADELEAVLAAVLARPVQAPQEAPRPAPAPTTPAKPPPPATAKPDAKGAASGIVGWIILAVTAMAAAFADGWHWLTNLFGF